MTILTNIGELITIDSNNNRPIITGTRASVRRIAGLYNQGNNAEEIARRLNHLMKILLKNSKSSTPN